jgi:hypothetical protein
VGNWLNRSDLDGRITEFITLAEARMERDKRIREVSTLDFNATEDYVLPGAFKAVRELSMESSGRYQYARLQEVSPGELAERKRRHGDSGIPRFFSVIPTTPNRTLRFAPEPSGTYALRMVYDTSIDALSDGNETNWLLDRAPDIYLWAALSVAEGYLQEDSRVNLWKAEYEQAASEYKLDRDRREYGGPLTPRPAHIIGEDVRSY